MIGGKEGSFNLTSQSHRGRRRERTISSRTFDIDVMVPYNEVDVTLLASIGIWTYVPDTYIIG